MRAKYTARLFQLDFKEGMKLSLDFCPSAGSITGSSIGTTHVQPFHDWFCEWDVDEVTVIFTSFSVQPSVNESHFKSIIN